MSVEYCIISIGALSHNRLWGEGAAVRSSHATTTYIESDDRRILVDPSLPDVMLESRFNERTGKTLADVTDVFCTTLRPVHRRSITALPDAAWWVNELELQSYQSHLEMLKDSADRLSEEDAVQIEADLELMERFRPAPDKFTEQVSLYPLGGASVGSAGLLLTPPQTTVAIAGDCAVTHGHAMAGQIWSGCVDAEAAMESFRELFEIADAIVPGHDNLMLTPRQQWM